MNGKVDTLNYYAIVCLEKLGNDQPTQEQIIFMEKILKLCGLGQTNDKTNNVQTAVEIN